MSLTSHAAYLYIHSKTLLKLDRKLNSLRENARKLEKKANGAGDKKREKIKTQLVRLHTKAKTLLKEREDIVRKLKHHHVIFTETLEKEERA